MLSILKYIKSKILNWLKGFDFYYKIRFTKPVVELVYLINPRLKKMIKPEDEFYRKLLTLLNSRGQYLVFDIGASIGQLTDVFLKENCKVIAVEPHPSNCRILEIRFRKANNLTIISKALSDREESVDLFADINGTSLHTLDENRQEQLVVKGKKLIKIPIETTTLTHLIIKYGKPDLIKIDVEGHEKSVLSPLNERIPIIVFECNLPEFRKATLEIIESLNRIQKETKYNFFDGVRLVYDSFIEFEEAYNFISNSNLEYFDVVCIAK